MLVIMADLLSRSVGTLFMAAIVPGLLLAALYAVYIVARCAINPTLAPPLPEDFGPRGLGPMLTMVVRSFVPPVVLIVMVLGSILMGLATPTEAAGVGAVGATLLALVNLVLLPKIGVAQIDIAGPSATKGVALVLDGLGPGSVSEFWQTFRDVIDQTAQTNAMIFGVFIGATLFSYIFRALGGDALILGAVETMGLGSWGLLLIVLGLVFLLGFFFDWIEITLIVLPIFMPIMTQMDFGDHVAARDLAYWIAILIAINLQTSFLTPPFGFALFFLKATAPEGIRIQQIYRGIIPFVLLQLFALTLVIVFPDIAMWLPRVMLE